MNKFKKNLISAFLFLFLIALTVAVYFILPYEKMPIDNIILCDVIASQVITLLGTLFYNSVSSKQKLTMTAGGYTALFGYQALMLIASVLFALYYRNAVSAYKIFFVCLTGLMFISVILVYSLGKKIADKSNDIDYTCRFFKELEYKTEKLNFLDCEKSIHSRLEKIDDAIKSCDQSVFISTDKLINDSVNCLLQLLSAKEDNNAEILEMCEKTIRLINQRNAQVCKLKIGGV